MQVAIEPGGSRRDDAWVAKPTAEIDLPSWSERTLARLPPQLSFTDHEGHRFAALVADTGEDCLARAPHHRREVVADAILCGKESGMRNLSFHDFALNEVWLELSLLAQDLLAWVGALARGSARPRRAKAATPPADPVAVA